MQGETRTVPGRSGQGPATLVLLCREVERPAPGQVWAALAEQLELGMSGVVVRLQDGICRQPRLVQTAVQETGAQRLVLGLCTSDYPEAEFQAYARKAGLDPLSIQIVDVGACAGTRSQPTRAAARTHTLLAAAIVRAMAYPGARPENLKSTFLPSGQKRSRAALFRLPPVSYVSVPTINQQRCAAEAGCDACVGSCPAGALMKAGEVILVDRSLCVSCGLCVAACPYRAVELPGWSPGEIEAQLASFLAADTTAGGRRVAFVCKQARLPAEGDWLPVRLPCAAMAPEAAILQALARGASEVALSPCAPTCPPAAAQIVRERIEFCREVLRLLTDSPERVKMLTEHDEYDADQRPVPSGGPVHASAIPAVFGSSAAARAVRELAGQHGVDDLVVEDTRSPLGLVEIDSAACTGCGSCTEGCPTVALALERRGGAVALTFDASLCTGCGSCLARCPERTAGAIAVRRAIDLRELARGPRVLFQDDERCCVRCQAPVASRRVLSRLAALLGDDYNPRLMERLCVDCRGETVFGR